ncbi:MAG: CysB family HTH-type transcriptional regulator [Oxalobacter sp.]|nr:MAG: CysB family HTH-type transcriptional regulator [Oxalobacter sp.]
MNFQQLRIIRETVRCNFNLTEVGNALYTSQSGVSKHIKDLEDELGVELFVRKGKRLLGLTNPGKELLAIVERMLIDANNIKKLADQFVNSNQGQLTIATTHSQAKYVLPQVIVQFKLAFPNVQLALHQGSPADIARMLIEGKADIGIATEALGQAQELASFPYYDWRHVVIVPKGHALEKNKKLSLNDLTQYPIITYNEDSIGRHAIDETFAQAGVSPNMTITALDADVIKTYVELGLGVGIVASMAYDAKRDETLSILGADLFKENTTRIAVRRGHFLRGYAYQFIQFCSPSLDESTIRAGVVLYPELEEASSASASL